MSKSNSAVFIEDMARKLHPMLLKPLLWFINTLEASVGDELHGFYFFLPLEYLLLLTYLRLCSSHLWLSIYALTFSITVVPVVAMK